MKHILCLLLALLCLLPACALADGVVYNRTGNLTEEYVFPDGAAILEIVFPRVYSSDCAILRFGDEVVMIDASTKSKTMQTRIRTAAEAMGIDHIDTAYNSHPHDDHIDGFQFVHEYAPLGRLIITFPENYNAHMKAAVRFCNANGIPVVHMADGDVFTMGPNGEVTLRVIQRWGTNAWDANDQSALLLVQYGERTILFAGDVENRAQLDYGKNVPEPGLKADILKMPHHGQQPLQNEFLAVVQPELVFMNGAADVMDGGKKCLNKHGVPFVLGYQGLTRMRTDGAIWVVDYLHEENTDRTTINPNYITTTDIP